jgi:proteic killer suppression protein
MIKSFQNALAEAAWQRRFIKGVPNDIVTIANRKLTQIHNARSLNDLRVPPGNRLERLSGNRKGQHTFGSMINGGFVFSGATETPTT